MSRMSTEEVTSRTDIITVVGAQVESSIGAPAESAIRAQGQVGPPGIPPLDAQKGEGTSKGRLPEETHCTEQYGTSNDSKPNAVQTGMYQPIPRIDASEMTPEALREYVCSVPIVFVTGLMDCMDPVVFSMAEMASEYGDKEVDVLIQDPDSAGFSIRPNKRIDHTLGDYVKYAESLRAKLGDEDLPEIDRRVLQKMFGEATVGCDILQYVGRTFPGCPSVPTPTSSRKINPTPESTNKSLSTPKRRMMGDQRIMEEGSSPKRRMMDRSPSSAPQRTATTPASSAPATPVRSPSTFQQQKMIKFCVNVDCAEWTTVTRELSKLPDWCKWGKHDEVLSHLPSGMSIPGMSLPQLYFKVPGVWTGAHEENIRFHSINNNHGPGNSIWGAIAPEHAARFRQVVLDELGVDVYNIEGRYFPSVEFCVAHGIPVMIGVQRPGDTAILNGGTLHWVRSGGFAVNSSWNFGLRRADQLELAFQRDKINYDLKIRNIVPLRCLVLELLNDFRNRTMDRSSSMAVAPREQEFLTCGWNYLVKQADTEKQYLHDLEKEAQARSKSKRNRFQIYLEPVGSFIVICDRCWREIVQHYIVCETCAESNTTNGVENDADKALPVFFCVPCGLAHAKDMRNHHQLEGRYKGFNDTCSELEDHLALWKTHFDEVVRASKPDQTAACDE